MGRIISRKYEELELLGQGGRAAVYKVRHVDLKTIRKNLPLRFLLPPRKPLPHSSPGRSLRIGASGIRG